MAMQVVSIMETFFDVEDGEVENLAPQVCSTPQHVSNVLWLATCSKHIGTQC